MLKLANTSHLDFDSNLLQQSKLGKYLGGQLDSSHTFEKHVKTKIKSSNVKLHKNQGNKIQSQYHYLNYPRANAMHFSPRLLKCSVVQNHQEATTKIPKDSTYVCKIGPQQA